MERNELEAWLHAVRGFNDFEEAFGDHAEAFAMLPGAAGLEDFVHPLGFHGSHSWIALWRKDPATPWGRAAMVWIDSEGDPWDAFAATPEEGLAMLALDTGAVYDALSAACHGASRAALDAWAPRTTAALAASLARYPAQAEHRARLATGGIALPINALATAHAALTTHGRFSPWLEARASARVPPPKKTAAKKTAAKKTAAKKTAAKRR